jgi:endonuclease/exonuclease/phosphatase (EEP) superfamily protein YafD
LRLISWNLYYRRGAAAADIAALIEQYRPDIFLMQEALGGIESLPRLVAGQFHPLPWMGKHYGLAAWLPVAGAEIGTVDLPYSRLPVRFPPRKAQIIRFDDISIANVHLSHGQFLNRRQLRRIAANVPGSLAIVGDFNIFGPIVMRGFADIGPRGTTHYAQRVLPLRLDRCVARGILCTHAEILDRGSSDHRPILIDLTPH